MSNSDWDSVTKIGKSVRPNGAAPKETVIRGNAALNAAKRSGAAVETSKKQAGSGSGMSINYQQAYSIENDPDIRKPKVVSRDVGAAMQKARSEYQPKALTQKDLAKLANTTAQIVQDLESGKAVPDQKNLTAIERVLKVKLRGNNIGEPLFKKAADKK